MAKLYWRIKKDEKWTWVPAQISRNVDIDEIVVLPFEEEE